MMQTVRDACQFDPKAIDYALSEQIETLEDLVGHDTTKAQAFFAKTYVTERKKSANVFDQRYAAGATSDDRRWELCERVLARTDVTKRLSLGWGEREKNVDRAPTRA